MSQRQGRGMEANSSKTDEVRADADPIARGIRDGVPIVPDPDLPDNVYQLRDGFGSVIWEWDLRDKGPDGRTPT